MKGWGEEVKESAQNLSTRAKDFAGTRGKAFAAEANEAARRGGRALGISSEYCLKPSSYL